MLQILFDFFSEFSVNRWLNGFNLTQEELQ